MKLAKNLEITVRVLGRPAREMLQGAGQLTVLGVTSRGAFLQRAAGSVCFLSQERWRGPLTANLRERVSLRDCLRVGEQGLIDAGQMAFPACRISLPEAAAVWEPALVPMDPADLPQALFRGAAWARSLAAADQGGLFQGFYPAAAKPSWEEAEKALLALIPSVSGQGSLLAQLPELLGLGEGLTPAGDDFICGWLLARHALEQNFSIPEHAARSLADLPALARERTSALSASLIACAAGGQADERLMQALSWLLTGAGDAEKIKEELLTYGSSSGSDAMAGMLASLMMVNDTP